LHHRVETVKSKCFEPIARADARVLILGSLPGQMSLARGQYYAQPYNAFWRIMGELVGASPDVPYHDRVDLLKQHHIAVWEVCAAGFRAGSLDSAIQLSTVRVNDFATFLRAHPGISLICFNGRKAEEIYTRKVRKEPRAVFERIRYASLPSSSAAHAGMPFAQKLALWRNALTGTATLRRLGNTGASRPSEEVEIHSFAVGS
jgi:double-stranded uracil-DNA glycosylase